MIPSPDDTPSGMEFQKMQAKMGWDLAMAAARAVGYREGQIAMRERAAAEASVGDESSQFVGDAIRALQPEPEAKP